MKTETGAKPSNFENGILTGNSMVKTKGAKHKHWPLVGKAVSYWGYRLTILTRLSTHTRTGQVSKGLMHGRFLTVREESSR